MAYLYSLIIVLTLLFAGPSAAETKSVSFSTYFPPPASGFDRIQLVPQRFNNILGNACDGEIGTLYIESSNNTLYFCQDADTSNPSNTTGFWTAMAGIWRQTPNNQYIVLTDNGSSTDRDSDSTPDINEIFIGVGTNQPFAHLTLRAPATSGNDGGIIASGPQIDPSTGEVTSANVLQTSGTGTRFFWYPRKAALRAGTVNGTQWNNANIGVLSVAFGENSLASALMAVVRGGQNNSVYTNTGAGVVVAAEYSTVGGGQGNTVSGANSVIVGGTSNSISSHITNGFIGGGQNNTISKSSLVSSDVVAASIIAGGQSNTGTDANNSAILGGANNTITSNLPTVAIPTQGRGNLIGGGTGNAILQGINRFNIIYGGSGNQLRGEFSAIGGGQDNLVGVNPTDLTNTTDNCFNCTVLGGQNNKIYETGTGRVEYAFLGSGQLNRILSPSTNPGNANYISIGGGHGSGNSGFSFAAIGGGLSHLIGVNTTYSAIGGGYNNRLDASTDYAMIGGGNQNFISGDYSFIGGGYSNSITGQYSTVLGGSNIIVKSTHSLAAGQYITLESGASYNFIWSHQTAASVSPTSSNVFIVNVDTSVAGEGASVGIGTATPTARLHIKTKPADLPIALSVQNGHIAAQISNINSAKSPLQRGPYSGPYGSFNDIIGVGSDLAESFVTNEDVEIGDVLVMDRNHREVLTKNTASYDHRVVGIVSAAPAILFEGNQIQIAPTPLTFTKGTKPPVALKGRVMVKVSLENGEIKPGDILTTSTTPGHAMKSTDPDREMGAVIGKALAGFKGGEKGENTGMIPVFVALH